MADLQVQVIYVLAATAVAVLAAIIWGIALMDVFQREESEFPPSAPGTNPRVIWTFVVVFLSVIGALVYYVMVMRPYPRRR